MAKKYVLAAWTEKGKVHMIPSLVNELSAPYREKIEHLEALYKEVENEIGYLLAKSRAHEEFARFLLRVGYPKEAYVEYANAAKVCAYCSDSLWLQGISGDYPALPLLYRFLSMHRECLKLIDKSPLLKACYEGSDLEELYRWFTQDDRLLDEQFDRCQETLRAWRFGRR